MAAPWYMLLYQGVYQVVFIFFYQNLFIENPLQLVIGLIVNDNKQLSQQTLTNTVSQLFLFKLGQIAMIASCKQVSEHYRSIISKFLPRVRLSTISASPFFQLKSLVHVQVQQGWPSLTAHLSKWMSFKRSDKDQKTYNFTVHHCMCSL